MTIDEQTLSTERLLLKKDFDNLSDKIKQFELDLGQMRGNLNALHGAIQQTDKLIKLCKE
ncbi:MAG: hypothetical protein RL221_1068 [Pseudomonadota bacterium]|jgi:hypothetical protein